MQQSLLQSKQWAGFKATQGWQPRQIGEVSVLERKLPMGKSLLYAPEVWVDDLKVIAQVAQNAQIAQNAIFFRLEILNPIAADYIAALEQVGFRKAFEQMQPEHRQVIDLAKPTKQLVAQMKPKGRYNIRVAMRHGVRVTTSNDISAFYQLYRESAKRDKFSARAEKYFEALTSCFPDQTEIFLAWYNNQPVAAALVLFWNDTASYLYGGSTRAHHNVMAPFLLHFKIIEQAQRRKMKYYDMLAVAPNEKPHKFAGLRRFKQQFGGRQVDLVGSWDLIFKPFWYSMFRLTEKIRRK